MRERIEIKQRTYSTSMTGQRSLNESTTLLTCWSDVFQKRNDLQDLQGTQNVLEGVWVFRIRNAELEFPITKSNFISWREKDYSVVSVSAQEKYQRMVEITCSVIE
jgi:head-tail adaptor